MRLRNLKKTGQAFIALPKGWFRCVKVDVKSLTADLGGDVNGGLPSWAMIMAIFGVSYVRPYAEQGGGDNRH
uniref:Uncharacterized protein n=1 Tax=Salmonella sp. TaxID=599 RepID=A0A482ETK8_SALSP|nr:hypothetical protein [Salmonella sp.]QBM91460.1 hypothetical protein NNIBIDOC_00131 [Salmonella sp.]